MDVRFDVLSDELNSQVGGVGFDQSSHKLETIKKAISLHRAAIAGKEIRLQEALASSAHALATEFSACEHPDA